jgi:nucleotide-binding universal stress UspA family protein
MDLDGAMIVVAAADSIRGRHALHAALRLAARHDAGLTVVAAAGSPAAEALHEEARQAAVELGVLLRCETRPGTPGQGAVAAARERGAALIVLGAVSAAA